MLWPITIVMSQMNKMYQTIDNMKAVDMNVGSTTIAEDLEVEGDSLEIMIINHDNRFNASHSIKKTPICRLSI